MSGKTITDGELLADLERVNDEVGGAATTHEYNERGEYHSRTFYQRFGSWAEAQQAAGEDIGERKKTHVPEEELAEDLERVNEELGHPAYISEYEEHGGFHPSTLIQRFGTWCEAHEAAGCDISYRVGDR